MAGDLGSALAAPASARPRQPDRGRAGPLHRGRQATFPRGLTPRRAAHRRRLRQWRRLQGRADRAVGAGRRGGAGRRRARRLQHQPGRRLHRARSSLRRGRCERGADLGIALDGDADRLVLVDEKGGSIDGDQIMALIAQSWQREGRLRGGGIVATVMSNLGLERYLRGAGLGLHAHPGRRPLRGRADARGRLQPRRRAVRPHHPDRFRHHRRRADRGAAGARGAGRGAAARPARSCRCFEPLPQLPGERALHRRLAARSTPRCSARSPRHEAKLGGNAAGC